MSFQQVSLDRLIKPAKLMRAGARALPILSMTMHEGLVDQASKFKKRVASADTADYKVVRRNQLVVGFPIDEGVLSIQDLYDEALVSPAYDVWDLQTDHEVEHRYLERFLRSPQALTFYASKLRGTTARRRTLPDDIFLKLEVPLPSLGKQQWIEKVLDRAKALQDKRHDTLVQVDTLAQSTFLEMFGDPTTNPKGWPRQTLGDITQKITDGEHLNPPFSKTGMPIVMAGDVWEDQINFRTCKMVESDIGYRFRRKCDPETDDILIVSRGATIGRLCVVGVVPEFCLMGSVILLKPLRDKINSRFLSVFLKHPVSRHALYKTSGSSAQQAIYIKDVKKLVCIVPPILLQREFAHRVAAIEKLKSIHRTSLEKLDALFASLQHRAFRGEL